MATKPTPQKVQFAMHPKLLLDVIQRQAGTLSKAILEAVMNAVDAKAKTCNITLTSTELRINNDGMRFTKDQILTCFRTFGLPHDEGEEKTYGTFRMGRGQLFAFGKNKWRSGTYGMVVNVKEAAAQDDYELGFQLHEGLKDAAGCNIVVELYEPIGLSGVEEARRDIERWCKYVPIKVSFNGKQVSTPPWELDDWDFVLPEAFIKLDDSPAISVYNLGVHVQDIGNYRYGTGGVVVSRQQLKVNFARNDIQSDCPVWKKILPKLKAEATEKNVSKKSLDDGGRQAMATQLKNGELSGEDGRELRLFTAVTGRHYSAKEVMVADRCNAYSVCHRGDRTGDMIMKRHIAFVFAQETLQRFGFETVPQLLAWMKKTFARDYELDYAFKKPYKPFAELSKGFKSTYQILEEDELTPSERMWLALLQLTACEIEVNGQHVYGSTYGQGRRLVIGVADKADGWTDAATYVAINRKFLARQQLDLAGFVEVALLLFHEGGHQSPDLEEHDHDQAFYEGFHDGCTGSMAAFITACVKKLPGVAERLEKKLNRRQMQAVDSANAAAHAARKVTDRVAARG